MSYSVKPGNIFGRIGTGIGKGLGEQIPKEIERTRLASGIESLNQEKGLSPLDYYTKALSIPGVIDRPEVVRQLAELSKQQQIRNAYRNRGGQETPQAPSGSASQSIKDVQFGQMPGQTPRAAQQPGQPGVSAPQGDFPPGTEQIVQKNPLSPELQPAIPWTPDQRDQEIQKVWDQRPWLTFPEVSQIVADNERRYLESPEAYQKQQESLKAVENEVNTEIDSQLRKKLQIPKTEELFGNKITGETINRIERGVAKDLRKNPNANVKDLVNTWTNRALDNDKTKSKLKEIGNRSFDENLFKKGENLEKLKSMSKTFKDFGNSEEYYESLRADPFGLSPEGAASIAYELSKQAKAYINKIVPEGALNIEAKTLKYAHDLEDYLTREDSILSIAKNIKEKDPYFDVKTFLSEVRSIQDELGLSPTQKRELETRGVSDFFPNWGDIFLFPKLGKGV